MGAKAGGAKERAKATGLWPSIQGIIETKLPQSRHVRTKMRGLKRLMHACSMRTTSERDHGFNGVARA